MPHQPTNPRLYRSVPIEPNGLREDDKQDFLISPYGQSIFTLKAVIALVGAAFGFIFGSLIIGLYKAFTED